jgi:hypothetical protein
MPGASIFLVAGNSGNIFVDEAPTHRNGMY